MAIKVIAQRREVKCYFINFICSKADISKILCNFTAKI